MMTDAPKRIKAYINTRSKHPKLDQDEIHALDAGTDREAFLRLSDVKAILDLYDAQAARIAELVGVLEIAERALHEHDTANYGWDEENPWTMGEWFDESDRAKIAAAVTALKGTDNG